MYAPLEPHAPLSQGDIIRNVVFTYIPDISNPNLFNEAGDELRPELAQPFPEDHTGILGEPHKSNVLVLTQSCDLDNRLFVNVACIFSLETFDPTYTPKSDLNKAKHLKNEYQRAGVRPYAYYLQECEAQNFPKSIASFLELHTIKKTDINQEYLIGSRVLRLNQEALEDLQFRIGYFFGRFALNTEDYMLTAGEKLLIHEDAERKRQQRAAGNN